MRQQMKIVILDGYALNPGDLSWEGFEKLGSVTVYDRTPLDKIVERIGDAEIIITNKTPLTEETLNECKNIKYIGVLATGYNVIDTNAAKARNIPVTNVPSYSTAAVAQLTIGLLLELCGHIGEHSASVMRGDWSECDDFCYWKYPIIELAGKTMGIIGFGEIGRSTARIAQALGMNVLAFARHRKSELESDGCKYVDFDELLKNSDVISLHCPLTPATQGIINRNTIEKMKNGVLILNTARGQLIVEEDLRDALNSGKVSGAACDTVSTEPIKTDNPLLQAKNMIITPHIAWASTESRKRLMKIAVNNLSEFLSGRNRNVVNF